MPKPGRVKWAKFRVLVLTVVSAAILGTMLYLLYGISLLAPKTAVYLYIPDASGLSDESPVRVDGIDVGRVSAVELSGSNQPARIVKVTISVERDRLGRIPADSVTQISSDSLVGDKFVDITSGTSPKPIPPEGELIYKDQPELLKSLDLTQFTQELRLVDATLTDIEQGRSEFGKFYQGTEMYNDLLRRMLDLQRGMRAAISTTGMVGSLMSTDRLHREISDLLVSVDEKVGKLQSGQGAAGQLLRSSAQYDQLLETAQGFRRSVEQLQANPVVQSDSAYAGATQWLRAMIQSVDEVNRDPRISTTAVYENLNGSLQELRDTMRDFRQNPKKYLRMKVF
jgi:phospholipid/cholesterol/gamma-HCH transport system substrate-binding protein